MEILFYRYNSIYEEDLIKAFQKLGLTVIEDRSRLTMKQTKAEQIVDAVGKQLIEHSFLFVFSVNFFPALSDVCEVAQVPYVCWTVDVPVLELFSPSLGNKCNRVFMFDRAQYEYFKDSIPQGIFHLPLATNPERWDAVIKHAKDAERKKYSADISFVGSLYSEKNAYKKINGMSDYAKGYVQGIIEAQMQIFGVNFIERLLTDELMNELDPLVPDLHQPLCEGNKAAQRYLIAHSFIGSELAETERIRYINALAEKYEVDLYTFSDTAQLLKVHAHKGVATLTEMPLVFHGSRINLNITMRPIETGLSLRIFDICGCGGFLLTNWQEELPELYEPGVEAEYFGSLEELLDKAKYYLEHDEERMAIARKGYERTKAEHTIELRTAEMIRILNGTI